VVALSIGQLFNPQINKSIPQIKKQLISNIPELKKNTIEASQLMG